jgi:hypothetical protein
VAVSLGLDSTYSITLNASTGVTATGDVALWKFPSGTTAVAKVPADQTAETFASALFKFKIPAQPKAPKVAAKAVQVGSPKVVVDYKLGLNDKLEVLTGKYDPDTTLDAAWKKASDLVTDILPKDLLASDFAQVAGGTFATGKFYAGKSDTTGVNAILIPVRTFATDKQAASAISYLVVPADFVVANAPTVAETLTFTTTTGGTIVGALAAGKYIVTVSDKEVPAASVKLGSDIPASATVINTSALTVATKYAIAAKKGQYVNVYKLNTDGTAYAEFESHKLTATEAPKTSGTVAQPTQ